MSPIALFGGWKESLSMDHLVGRRGGEVRSKGSEARLALTL